MMRLSTNIKTTLHCARREHPQCTLYDTIYNVNGIVFGRPAPHYSSLLIFLNDFIVWQPAVRLSRILNTNAEIVKKCINLRHVSGSTTANSSNTRWQRRSVLINVVNKQTNLNTPQGICRTNNLYKRNESNTVSSVLRCARVLAAQLNETDQRQTNSRTV